MSKSRHFTSFKIKRSDALLADLERENSQSKLFSCNQNSLKIISYKKNKVQEVRDFKAQNNNFYTRL